MGPRTSACSEACGYELAERLRSSIPGLRALYMSGYTQETMARADGLDQEAGFLEKPFTGETLASAVREVLEQDAG